MVGNGIEAPDSFPFYLKEWREKVGWTQEQLAHRVGKSKSQISRYEKGLRDPTLSSAQHLADALDIRIEDLFRPPNLPSADAILASLPREDRQRIMAMIEAYVKRN
jgi:transcriptional regulator with XRE-family HTH domain